MYFNMKQVVLCLSLFMLINFGMSVKLPQTFKRCKVNKAQDGKPNSCLLDAVQDAINQLTAKSTKHLGFQSLNDLPVKNMLLESGSNGPVALTLNLTNVHVLGLASTKFKSVSGKLSSPRDFVMNMDMSMDSVTTYGPYNAVGKILILPIQGNGIANITLGGIKGKITIVGEGSTKNGKEYLKLKDFKIKINPKRIYVHLTNLFNGDKALGNSMNKFLNENSAEIYSELQGPMEKGFSSVFLEHSRRILDRIPFNRIFITE